MLFQKLFNDETVYLVSEEAERQEFIKRLVCSKNKCSKIRVINVLSFVFLLLNVIQVRELLSQKLSSWQQSCSQPTKLPERALNLLRHTAPQSPGAAGIAEVLRHTKLGTAQPEQVRSCFSTSVC